MSGVATIGFGAMARSLAESLGRDPRAPQITDCLLRPGAAGPSGLRLHHRAETLIDARPALVVECAGPAAIAEHGPALLSAGIDLAIVSVGALCDDALHARLLCAARDGGAQMLPVTGAIGGLDLLEAARLAGLDSVTYRGIKPPPAWAGSPAEQLIDLGALRGATVFYRGTARQAAGAFPKNANVAAAAALAGTGLDATQVELVADPEATGNRHEILARGAFGEMRFEVTNRPLPGNPRTSWLAALSVEALVRAHAGR
ncbi:aspartate dehydrogenase [Pseudooceanicola sp. GBMRC 2024]|uniref:L-aspartate dehydrogenase n=1 Tax=Pseudooceanicola albus TaxID=2692189 RepID=A0A6L7G1K3_9RHOB|nr:aspartate dehydrogenase [Pseudooceanicola albus]MXN17935.1 aspartate dehydrogenase [Pseudooceanicola albus]